MPDTTKTSPSYLRNC